MTEAAIEALLTWFSKDELRAIFVGIHQDKINECNGYLEQLREVNNETPPGTDSANS